MPQTRRRFLGHSTAAAGALFLPFVARAQNAPDVFETRRGPITVHPVNHASIVLETPNGTIFIDPVGDPALYDDFRRPDLVMITHEHGDHYDPDTLTGIAGEATRMFTNPAVYDLLPEPLRRFSVPFANGEQNFFDALGLEAVPAYNTTPERLGFHPKGRDNGYILGFDGFRIYISGDTEDTPEMRGLTNIDLAFVCMNLPFTMDAAAAASAVNEFAPTYCYPYHYQGRGDGTQDPEAFAAMLNGVEAKFGDWYEA